MWKKGFKRRNLFLKPSLQQRKQTQMTTHESDEQERRSCTPMSASVGEQLLSSSKYFIHELADPESDSSFNKSCDPS